MQFEPAALSADAPVGLWGYSGGGQATAWAAEQHPTCAPEIRLAAVAAGGVPTDDGRRVFEEIADMVVEELIACFPFRRVAELVPRPQTFARFK